MASNPNLRVRVSADLADIKQGLAVLRGELVKVKKQGADAAPDESRWLSSLRAIRNQLAGVVSAYAAMRAVRTYSDLADQAAQLSARLRLATKDQEAFETAYRGTFAVAQQTASQWDSIAGLYARLTQSTTLGQERVLKLTETIAKAFQVSGSSPAEAERGITQLTQALAAGVLRAEEFQTLLDTSPRIVQALADQFDISFGQVRDVVNDGRVQTADFVAALENGAQSIDAEFKKLPATVSRSTQVLKNSFLALVAGADDSTHASRELARGISDLAATLESPEVKAAFQSIVGGIVATTNASASLIGTLNKLSAATQEWLNLQVGGQRQMGGQHLAEQRRELVAINAELEKQSRGGLRSFSALGLLSEKDLRNRRAEVERIIELNERLFGDPSKRKAAPSDAASSSAERRPSSAAGADSSSAKQVAASNALLRDSVSRALAELERLYAGNEVGMRAYFAERQRLQQQAIDLEIEQARNEIATTKDAGQRRNLEEQIVKLQRDRAALGATTAREQAAAEAELAKQLESVKLELLDLDGKTGEAERQRLEKEYRDLFARLEAAGDEAGQAIVRSLIDQRVIRAQLEDFRRQVTEALGSLQNIETSVSTQVDARTLGAAEGERRIQAARAKSLLQLQDLRDAVSAFYAETKDPSVLAFLESLDGNLAEVTMSMQEFRMKLEDQAESSFGTFISDLVEGTKDFKAAFQDMVRSFAAGVAQMIAQELALRAIRSLLSSFGSASTGVSAPVAHGGGVVGKLQMSRDNINPMVWGHAPRYHGGGVAGLKSDEVAAVLQRGETIRTRQQEAALTSQMESARQAGRGMVTTPIVAIGEQAIADALASTAGEQVVLTHIRNNWEGLMRGSGQ